MLAVVDLGFGFSICSDRAKAAAAAALARALCTGSGPLLLLLFLTGATDGACALGFADDGALLLLVLLLFDGFGSGNLGFMPAGSSKSFLSSSVGLGSSLGPMSEAFEEVWEAKASNRSVAAALSSSSLSEGPGDAALGGPAR